MYFRSNVESDVWNNGKGCQRAALSFLHFKDFVIGGKEQFILILAYESFKKQFEPHGSSSHMCMVPDASTMSGTK